MSLFFCIYPAVLGRFLSYNFEIQNVSTNLHPLKISITVGDLHVASTSETMKFKDIRSFIVHVSPLIMLKENSAR